MLPARIWRAFRNKVFSFMARSHAQTGLALQQQGRLGDALHALRKAVMMRPDDGIYWEYLAELYMERQEAAQARPCWERAFKLSPERATIYNGLGWALQNEYRLDEAAEHYRTALRLKADFGLAQMNLGAVYEERGELAEAETAFRAALSLQPELAAPHARLALLLRGKLPAADRAALEERLTDAKLPDASRASLLFGMAHVLDPLDDCARAADCLRQANALRLELDRRSKRAYDPAAHELYVDGLLREFGSDFFGRLAGAGLTTRRPVFVFGLPRSGTTLIEQVLASHSQVHGAGEVHFAFQSFEAVPAAVGRSEPAINCVANLDAAAIARLATQHVDRLSQLDADRSERIVDKMPGNYLYLGLLRALFPQATFIHCRRDLRDVAFSCWMTDLWMIHWANDPNHIASRFQQYRRLMDHWRTVLPGPIHEVHYEETVADLEGVARRLLAACGLEWEPACLDFHRSHRPVRTPSVNQVRQPIYTRSVARWKRYENTLADLFAGLPKD